MSDFLLDFRPAPCRTLPRVAQQLRFTTATQVFRAEDGAVGLVVAQTGDAAIWSPYRADEGSIVAVAGRTVFEPAEWESAETCLGSGGLAAQIIYARYRAQGQAALASLNGNCAVVVYDRPGRLVHLVTDCCGVFPTYGLQTPQGAVYCSHPDVLADATGEGHRLDEVSLAEFVLSGTVTPPFSFYQRIRAAECGTVFTFALADDGTLAGSNRRYFDFVYRGDPAVREEELADELALSLRRAVQRRTLPWFGRSAVALSGGLDSRVVLATALNRERSVAFCCYDAPNQELKIAEEIARALSVPFLPLRRSLDYYAEHAEAGVRISGGMGSFANNHFLGMLPRLREEGVANLLTGCYCDYLFKGLPLNRDAHWLTGRETLAPFSHQFYFDHFDAQSALAQRVRERWDSRIPRPLRNQSGSEAVFNLEVKRTFPLCYEGDNQQRLVPQRVTGWSPPFLDRDVLDVYCRTPYAFKLNRSLFKKVVVATAPGLRSIPDANTGARPDASAMFEWLRSSGQRVGRSWRRFSQPSANGGSWPNWRHYVAHSPTMDALWRRPNHDATDMFRRILGGAFDPRNVNGLKRDTPFLFVGLLNAKLWLDQRR